MGAITSPQARRFCDERVRPLADTIARVYSRIQTFAAEFEAKGLDHVIPDDDTPVAQDDADARTPITGRDVHQMMALAKDLLSMAGGPETKLPVVLKVAVNPE